MPRFALSRSSRGSSRKGRSAIRARIGNAADLNPGFPRHGETTTGSVRSIALGRRSYGDPPVASGGSPRCPARFHWLQETREYFCTADPGYRKLILSRRAATSSLVPNPAAPRWREENVHDIVRVHSITGKVKSTRSPSDGNVSARWDIRRESSVSRTGFPLWKIEKWCWYRSLGIASGKELDV